MATHDASPTTFEGYLGAVEPSPSVPQTTQQISKEKAMEAFKKRAEEKLKEVCKTEKNGFMWFGGKEADLRYFIANEIESMEKKIAVDYLDVLRIDISHWLKSLKVDPTGNRGQKAKNRYGESTALNQAKDTWIKLFSNPGTTKVPIHERTQSVVLDKWIEYLVRLTAEALIYISNDYVAVPQPDAKRSKPDAKRSKPDAKRSKECKFSEEYLNSEGVPGVPAPPAPPLKTPTYVRHSALGSNVLRVVDSINENGVYQFRVTYDHMPNTKKRSRWIDAHEFEPFSEDQAKALDEKVDKALEKLAQKAEA